MKYINWFKDLKKSYQIGVIVLSIIAVMFIVGLF
jgi:hypothetical protein